MKSPSRQPPARARWEVLPARGWLGWLVMRNGIEKSRRFFKYRAVDFAVAECNQDLELWGIRSELVIKGRDGRIQDARTYGDDPPQIKG